MRTTAAAEEVVVRGDSTLMDASSASGCDFPLRSLFHPRVVYRGGGGVLPGRVSFLLLGLVVLGICWVVRPQPSPPVTGHHGLYDCTSRRLFVMDRVAWPAGSIAIKPVH